MYNFRLTKKEIGILISTAILLPLFSFIAGIFTTDTLFHRNQNNVIQENKLDDIAAVSNSPQQFVAEKKIYYVVQAGLFSKYNNANRYQYVLHDIGIESQIINTPDGDTAKYRLILNIFNSRSDALKQLNAIKEKKNIELYVTHIEHDGLHKFMIL